MSDERATVPLSHLKIGTVITSDIFDAHLRSTKLVGSGIKITEQLLRQLQSRGVAQVVVSKRDLASMYAGTPQGVRSDAPDHHYPVVQDLSPRSRALDDEIRRSTLPTDVEPADSEKVVRVTGERQDPYDPRLSEFLVAQREKHIQYVDGLFEKLVSGAGADANELSNICRTSVRGIVEDKDLFLCLGLNPFDAGYPARHSLHVASVAISIGVVLGLDDESLNDLGTGCLIHDVGMLKLNKRLYKATRKLNGQELAKLAHHPVFTLDALACPGVRISRVARIVAFQIHERCNGSGYPLGRRSEEIHALSKIAAVADAYIGLVSDRSHRRALIPYFAVKKLLESIPAGLYDAKAVRGLLNAISLFPIGSFVQTNLGQIGRVVRTTESYMTPVIELWDERNQMFGRDLVNLSHETSIKIVKAAVSPQRMAA